MGKIINHASECGYRKRLRKNQYPKWVARAICTKLPVQTSCNMPMPCVTINEVFPSHCPLLNGVAIVKMRGMSTRILPNKKQK